jgi:NAD(P)-dependent dehydrogenase (short-subunit alcohol dehydrogenase family)
MIGEDNLNGRVAIVTGGTVGIGRATCLALAKEGAHVVAIGRKKELLNQTMEELGHLQNSEMHLGLSLDVRCEMDMQQMVERTMDQFGRIDILITAAGILRPGGSALRMLQQMSVDEWDDVIDTNLKGVFLSNRAVLPAMINRRGGNIVNLSSTSGRKGLAYDTAYCASKFGVIGLSEALAIEMQQYGIRVQVLLPGAIDTGMWDQNGPLPPPKDILAPERVADLILYIVCLPEDMMIATPIIEPFKTRLKKGWLGHASSDDSRIQPALKSVDSMG